ncbi:MAG TPA: AtpZ/AtpI family protein [Flavisolibacter sp.]
MSQPRQNKSNELLRYAGLGTQIFVGLGLAVFAGMKIDERLHVSMPVLAWVLPLIVIIAMIYKLIKETSKRKPTNDQKG